MNKKLRFLFGLFFTFTSIAAAHAQCTPGDSLSCPDPEGNGQICPDTIKPAYIDVAYGQEITFIAPKEFDSLGIQVALDHVTLVSVDGLPSGIDWQTNAENNEFTAGVYYCILFSGTTSGPPGDYPLKIVVDVYGYVLDQVVKLLTTTDSTSLSMQVTWNPNGVEEYPGQAFINRVWPNPFSNEITIGFNNNINGPCQLEIYNLLGNLIVKKNLNPKQDKRPVTIDGSFLPEGVYFISLKYNGQRYSKLVNKVN